MKVGTRKGALCLLAVALILVGCGKKRPPAVATTSPGAGSSVGRSTAGTQPVTEGPDGAIELAGPAVLVARGTLDLATLV